MIALGGTSPHFYDGRSYRPRHALATLIDHLRAAPRPLDNPTGGTVTVTVAYMVVPVS